MPGLVEICQSIFGNEETLKGKSNCRPRAAERNLKVGSGGFVCTPKQYGRTDNDRRRNMKPNFVEICFINEMQDEMTC
jgi:hypothetical protein